MAIARFPSIVIDCPDPGVLATFYGAMLDWKVDVSSDWAEVRADYGQCICFQQVETYTRPRWPTQEGPQQVHLDVIVDKLNGLFGNQHGSGSAAPEAEGGGLVRL